MLSYPWTPRPRARMPFLVLLLSKIYFGKYVRFPVGWFVCLHAFFRLSHDSGRTVAQIVLKFLHNVALDKTSVKFIFLRSSVKGQGHHRQKGQKRNTSITQSIFHLETSNKNQNVPLSVLHLLSPGYMMITHPVKKLFDI